MKKHHIPSMPKKNPHFVSLDLKLDAPDVAEEFLAIAKSNSRPLRREVIIAIRKYCEKLKIFGK